MAGRIYQHAAIERLPDDVLIEIFSFDRLVSTWEWHRLVHVCRRWRYVIFGSPRSLDLQLLCTHGTPVKNNLDCWPTLPIVMRYAASSSLNPLPEATGEEDNIIAALQHPDRICIIEVAVTTPLLKKLATLVPAPFLALKHLELMTQIETGLTLPSECFAGAAPLLRILRTAKIGFSALPQLLLSAPNLVSIQLEAIPSTGYISPEVLITCLSMMSHLTTFHLEFLFPTSRPISGKHQPPQRYAVLPALEYFTFYGSCEYLECLLSGIHIPLLKSFYITFFNQAAIFDIPQLLRFLCRTETQRSNNDAWVYRSETDISITLSNPRTSHRMELRVSCRHLDWQMSSLAEICDKLSPIISDVRDLHIDASSPLPSGQDDLDPLPTLELFRPFGNVERLFLTKNVASHVRYALEHEMATGVLSNAEVIHMEEPDPLVLMKCSFKVIATKQRALLVGIAYCNPSNTWPSLDGPYGDVDCYQELLTSA
jgi:F-box-like